MAYYSSWAQKMLQLDAELNSSKVSVVHELPSVVDESTAIIVNGYRELTELVPLDTSRCIPEVQVPTLFQNECSNNRSYGPISEYNYSSSADDHMAIEMEIMEIISLELDQEMGTVDTAVPVKIDSRNTETNVKTRAKTGKGYW